MIVSHRHRFIFVKTLKTAGTSIEQALARHCGPEDVVTPIFPPVEDHAPRNWRGLFAPWLGVRSRADLSKNLRELAQARRFYNHIPARFARARLPARVWDGYLTFCVERNPWDKTLSHYHMFRNADWHRHHDPGLTLDGYLAKGVFCRNAPFYCDADGRVIVDRVLPYDRLAEALAELMEELGLPFEGLPRAKAGLRADRRSHREVFAPAQRRLIERAFADEIALHGWEY